MVWIVSSTSRLMPLLSSFLPRLSLYPFQLFPAYVRDYWIKEDAGVGWNVGVGPTASFTRAITSFVFEVLKVMYGPFDYIIKVHLSPTETQEDMDIVEELAIAVAKDMGTLDEEHKKMKETADEVCYCSYRLENDNSWKTHLFESIVPRTFRKLSNSKYLLMVDNLHKPITSGHFFDRVGLPPPLMINKSKWLISTASTEVCDMSKSEDHKVFSLNDNDLVRIIAFALYQSANSIFNAICQKNEKHWHHIALRCFHYSILFAHSQHGDDKCSKSITSDELIRQWVAEGLLTKPKEEENNKKDTSSYQNKYYGMCQVGKVILEAFQKYSLLQLSYFSSSTHVATATASSSTNNVDAPTSSSGDCYTNSAAQFLEYYGLIGELLEADELSDNERLKNINWISFMNGKLIHLSMTWLNKEIGGPTTIILRGCSNLSLLSHFDHLLPKLHYIRVLDLSYTPLKSLPSLIGCLVNLRLLSLRGCCHLETLCNSYITSTTNGCDGGSNSRSNSTSPLSQLNLLEVLDMNGVPFLDLNQEIGNKKRNLCYLDLSHSKISTFPYSFFQDMSSLEDLILVDCSNLKYLPPSMSMLSSLMTLEVTGTQIESFPEKTFEGMQQLQSLKLIDNKFLIALPTSLSKAQGLKELHIQGCNDLREAEVFGGASLKTVFLSGALQWKYLPKSLVEEASHGCLEELHIEGWGSTPVEEIKMNGHPTLRSFSLISGSQVRRLSLRGCRKLECVNLRDLGALEELDLSATAVKELAADIPNFPKLRRLLLLGVPSLKRFPWHQLRRFPDVFYLDHCPDEIGATQLDDNHSHQVAHIHVSDSRLFYSFDHDNAVEGLVRRGKFLHSFYVSVAPCTTRVRKKLQDEEDLLDNKFRELIWKQSPYSDVYLGYSMTDEVDMMPMVKPPLRRSKRHVEISTMDRYPHGLKHLLDVTKSVSVSNDAFVSDFSDLSAFHDLEECELKWCHQMEVVFRHPNYPRWWNLRNVRVSHLKSLYGFCYHDSCYFDSLEHLHLEHCPRLEYVMSSYCYLPKLKTLHILFCPNLNAVFYKYSSYIPSLPRLEMICLQELPRLQHLNEDNLTMDAPTWRELRVRGCRGLRRLPLLDEQPEKKVEVNGEREWWGKLRWDTHEHERWYEPKLPPEFASLNGNAKMKSYLV